MLHSGFKPLTTVIASILALAGFALPAAASQFGRSGFTGNPDTNGGATCRACHASVNPQTNLILTLPPFVEANATVTITAIISGGAGATAGFAVSTSGGVGSFSPLNDDVVVAGNEITHRVAKPFTAGVAVFQFDWTAPPYDQPVTFYSAANSSNGALDLLGDSIRTRSNTITVAGGEPLPPPPPPEPDPLVLEPIASGFQRPVKIASAGDERLFVVEQRGSIRIIEADGTVRATPYLDIRDRVLSAGGEQGLLGLAFHPHYALKGFFYVYYTVAVPGERFGRSRVSRFRVSDDGATADPDSELVLLEFRQTNANHNGGDIHFGPDGHLYIASGDGGGAGDPFDAGQDPHSLLGKILRIDPDGGGVDPDCDATPGKRAFGIPGGNAYGDGPGGEGCDEIWASGLRNPWRMSFDRETGDLWIADVGQFNIEEVNFVRAGSPAGLNFGWHCYEGNNPFNAANCSDEYTFPVHEAFHASGDCSITGGFVYRGAMMPEQVGRYFYSDFCNPSIRALERVGDEFVTHEVAARGAIARPTSFGEDAEGELYVASWDGTIYWIRQNDGEATTATAAPFANGPVAAPSAAPIALALAIGALGAGALRRRRPLDPRG